MSTTCSSSSSSSSSSNNSSSSSSSSVGLGHGDSSFSHLATISYISIQPRKSTTSHVFFPTCSLAPATTHYNAEVVAHMCFKHSLEHMTTLQHTWSGLSKPRKVMGVQMCWHRPPPPTHTHTT
jgi:hypothetical protein